MERLLSTARLFVSATRLFVWTALFACGVLASSCFDATYPCTADDMCKRGGATGYCHAVSASGASYCVFADSHCPNGLRWDDTALGAIGGTCEKSSCSDGILNGAVGAFETDVDCGGGACGPCGDGKACLDNTDCTSGICDAGLHCQKAACKDKIKNGDETDIDCGGSCSPCPYGRKCGANTDCASRACRSNNKCGDVLHFDTACHRLGGGLQTIATGDFNRDALPDLVAATDGGDVVVLLAGKGSLVDRTFYRSVIPAGLVKPERIAVADFDKDMKLDIAIVDYAGPVLVLFGNGDGTFAAPVRLPADPRAHDIAVGDFAGSDGKLDIAIVIDDPMNEVIEEFPGLDGRAFAAPFKLPVPDQSMSLPPSHLLVGDYDDDLKPDFAVARGADVVSFVLSSGLMVPDALTDNSGNASFMRPAHFSGHDDIVLAGDGGLTLLRRDTHPINGMLTPGLFENFDYLLSFFTPRGKGKGPTDLVQADFNGDGKDDLAAILNDPGILEVILATGSTTDPVYNIPNNIYLIGDNPKQTGMGPPASGTAGDFNGDGKADLAVVVEGGAEACILPGNGNGEFGDETVGFSRSFAAGSLLGSVATGDFNGDGHPDVAAGDGPSEAVLVLFGDGKSGMEYPTYVPTNGSAGAVAVGLLDGDTLPDIVAINTSGPTRLAVLLAHKDKTFSSRSVVYDGNGPYAVAIGDFNIDGNKDLAVTNNGEATFTVLRGDGMGNFAKARTFTTVAQPTGVVAADFDGDGYLDVAVAGQKGALAVHYGMADPMGMGEVVLSGPVPHAIGVGAVALAVADFNGDHKPDLVVSNGADNSVQVILGAGGRDAAAWKDGPKVVTGGAAQKVVVGDFDANNTTDVAIGVEHGLIEILLGMGDGTFAPPALFSSPYGTNGLATVDFNGDKRLDLVLSVSTTASVNLMLNDSY